MVDKQRHSRRLTRPRIATGIVLLGLLAAACGGGAGERTESGKIRLTEIDYFQTGGSNAATNWYIKKFEEEHPNVDVQRNSVPFENLITKVLQNASARNMPNLVMLDNPNVPEVAATGQLRPLDDLPGFTTKGYYQSNMEECEFEGEHYCYPIGTNSLGLFYNMKMLDEAGVDPPRTWDELVEVAGKLTKGNTHGIAFSAAPDEQATWQLEPFLWSNGATLANVNSPEAVQALELWTELVQKGYASKSVLQWGQTPDVVEQFIQGRAAMMVNGPWNFPLLNDADMKYNEDYGIVPIPTREPGQTVRVPLGGEVWALGNSGTEEQKRLAWEFVKGMQEPQVMEHITSEMYYLPTKPTVTEKVLKKGPEYTVFAKQTQDAFARTAHEDLGADYPKVSQAVWTAIQASLSGASEPKEALDQAQTEIDGIVGQ